MREHVVGIRDNGGVWSYSCAQVFKYGQDVTKSIKYNLA